MLLNAMQTDIVITSFFGYWFIVHYIARFAAKFDITEAKLIDMPHGSFNSL